MYFLIHHLFLALRIFSLFKFSLMSSLLLQTEDTKKPDAVTKGATGKQKSAPAKNHAKTAADGDDHMKITAQKVGTGGNI